MAKGLSDKFARTRFGSFFFEGEESVSDVPEQPVKRSPPVTAVRPTPLTMSGSYPSPMPSPNQFVAPTATSVDPEVKAKIQSIADQADQKSFTKFMELVSSMRPAFGSDETACYRAALLAGKAFSLTQAEVLRGVDVILNDLSRADKRFNDAVPQQISARVGARQQKVAGIRQTVSLKREEVGRLRDMIVRLEGEISQLAQDEQVETTAMAQDERSVSDDAAKFAAAMEAVRAPYLTERQKIEVYGGREEV